VQHTTAARADGIRIVNLTTDLRVSSMATRAHRCLDYSIT